MPPQGERAHITESLFQKYQKALQANERSREVYVQLRKEIESEPAKEPPSDSASALESHLNNLRTRRRSERTKVLAEHASQAEGLAEASNLLAAPPRSTGWNVGSRAEDASDLAAAQARLTVATQNLEEGVLQHHHRLTYEKALLQEVKRRETMTFARPTSPATRLQALLAVRSELSEWIQQSLARCDELSANGQATRTVEQDGVEWESVDTLYEDYVRARRRLLAAKQSLLHLEDNEVCRADRQSHEEVVSEPTSSVPAPVDDTLSHIEALHCSKRHLRDVVMSYRRQLNGQLEDLQKEEIRSLHRLREESHLTASYPISSTSNRVLNAKRVFRHHGHTDKNVVTETDEVTNLLDPWSFAVDAAETMVGQNIKEHLDRGWAALDAAERDVATLEAERSAWISLARATGSLV